MSKRDPFGSQDGSKVSADAELRISIDRIEGKDVWLTIHAAAPGLPVLKISENQLRVGDTLTLRDIEIKLKLTVT